MLQLAKIAARETELACGCASYLTDAGARVSYATRKQELQLATEKGKRPVHLSTISRAHTTAPPGQRSHLAEKTRGLMARGAAGRPTGAGVGGRPGTPGPGTLSTAPRRGLPVLLSVTSPRTAPHALHPGLTHARPLTPAPHRCWSSPTGPEFKKQFRNITLHLYTVLKQSLKYVQKQYSAGMSKISISLMQWTPSSFPTEVSLLSS